MLKKGNKINSILTGSCPKCHTESMYKNKNAYKNILSGLEMNEKCSHCGTYYKIEPSFFYGAMYVSYGLSIAFAFAAFTISYGIFSTSLITSFISIVITLVLSFPVILRLSRNIWINMFVNYDKEAIEQYKNQKQ
jgi:uncharacterized protein (DUF983 family)